MSNELEEHLRNHARSFDGLLSLIPAKLYYGEDVSDQWKRKKQTPEQKRAAKMAKLDPDNWKSAKDVMDERAAAAKRKREDVDSQGNGFGDSEVQTEHPKHLQDQGNNRTKKRKLDTAPQSQKQIQPLTIEERKQRQVEKKAAKKEKAQKEKEKHERQKARKLAEKELISQGGEVAENEMSLKEPIRLDQKMGNDIKDSDQWSTTSSNANIPDIFSPPAESGASSISSIPASIDISSKKTTSNLSKKTGQLQNKRSQQSPAAAEMSVSPPKPQPATDREAARARLADAISSFRSARKADEPTSSKPRNRAELLEQRRRKEEAKKQAKKEQRRKEREEAALKEDEEIAKRFSPGGSGSLLASPRSPPSKDNDSSVNTFSYGRIQFSDGTKVDSTNLTGTLDPRKRKGPQDASTALKAAKGKASRLAGLDEEKRTQIEQQDMWLNAKRRAHGERVKDDTSLLKKALKRQENQKKKSEKEWTDRKEGVVKAQEAKQKKRTENLAKRKEDKMAHKVGKKGKKVTKRPGFEGSFRGRTGGGKKS